MKKDEFRKTLDDYITRVIDYFENDLSHSDAMFTVEIERHEKLIKISNKVLECGRPFNIQPPMLLQNPKHKNVKPKSFQAVLDEINDIID